MVAIAEARPPYVTFELRAVEDRAASIESGHFVAMDVPYAIVTPQGSKDRIERQADDWFAHIQAQAQEGRFPAEWVRAFKAAYADWLEGNEPALTGTDIRMWAAASPAQIAMLRDVGIRTVEDLAGANEEAIRRIGMGGRALKSKAEEWLASIRDSGKQAEALAALRAENEDLRGRNAGLEKQLQELAARVAAMEQPSGAKKL